MVIRYGESLWAGTSPRPGEDGSYKDQPWLTQMGGRVGCQPFPLAASSRVMGWSTCNLLYSLICIIPRVLITSANWVCIVASEQNNIQGVRKVGPRSKNSMHFVRPFATNDHMVQSSPYWRASSLLFPHWDIKTKASQAWLIRVSSF